MYVFTWHFTRFCVESDISRDHVEFSRASRRKLVTFLVFGFVFGGRNCICSATTLRLTFPKLVLLFLWWFEKSGCFFRAPHNIGPLKACDRNKCSRDLRDAISHFYHNRVEITQLLTQFTRELTESKKLQNAQFTRSALQFVEKCWNSPKQEILEMTQVRNFNALRQYLQSWISVVAVVFCWSLHNFNAVVGNCMKGDRPNATRKWQRCVAVSTCYA